MTSNEDERCEMKLLTTIYRNENVYPVGKTFLREAVRGIIFRDGKLLMIHSTVNGDYKFPGGGMDSGESHLDALRREISEECGATLGQVAGELGKTLEYATSIEEGFESYKQISYYYFCEVNGEFGKQALEDYEEELGFRPVWVDVESALLANQKIVAEANPIPRWTRREAFVLGVLKKS